MMGGTVSRTVPVFFPFFFIFHSFFGPLGRDNSNDVSRSFALLLGAQDLIAGSRIPVAVLSCVVVDFPVLFFSIILEGPQGLWMEGLQPRRLIWRCAPVPCGHDRRPTRFDAATIYERRI